MVIPDSTRKIRYEFFCSFRQILNRFSLNFVVAIAYGCRIRCQSHLPSSQIRRRAWGVQNIGVRKISFPLFLTCYYFLQQTSTIHKFVSNTSRGMFLCTTWWFDKIATWYMFKWSCGHGNVALEYEEKCAVVASCYKE